MGDDRTKAADAVGDWDGRARPMGPGDLEQAYLFAEILRSEVADLQIRLREAEDYWERRCHRSDHQLDPPRGLIRLREQLDQALNLLEALRRV
jgi:hypothetical protein